MTAPARFHHSDPGTGEVAWLGSPQWDAVPRLDLAAVVRRYPHVLVVSAHPDDETIGVGGLVSELADAGAGVTVVVATAGERSHPAPDDAARDRLARRRRHEVERAVSGLAPGARVVHLGLPDGRLAELESRLVHEVTTRSDTDTLVLAPWLEDGHADHDAAGRACATAVLESGSDIVYYPIWLWHWEVPDRMPWQHVVALEPSLTSCWRKRAALEEFPSQTTAWGEAAAPSDVPVLGQAVLDRARRLVETLIDPTSALPSVATSSEEQRLAARDRDLDGMYDRGPDPWSLEGSFYEERRRALVLAALGRRRYDRVLEIGCADGQLTRALLDRAGSLVALDTSRRAVETARGRAPGAQVHHGVAPQDVPEGPFDLVVLSEVGYFLTPLELIATLRRSRDALALDGELLLCHWQHPTTAVPLDGVLVHEQATTLLGRSPRAVYVDDDLRIDVWGDPPSVAEREGRA